MTPEDRDRPRRSAQEPVARSWTLESANQILPDVRERTARARAIFGPLRQRRDGHAPGTEERVEAEQGMRRCLGRWVREMEALGIVVRGLWRVEFISESGAFPWQWPETTLRSVRESEEGSTSIH